MNTVVKALIMSAIMLAGCSGGPEAPEDVTQSAYFSDTDRIIDLDGQSVRVRDTGPRDAQPVLLLHGFTDSLQTWEAVADALDETYRVVRPDLPGHGLSGPDPDGDYSNEALVDFIGDLITAENLESPVIVGNSLGGLAAWRFVSVNPDASKALVLLAPGGVPHNGVGDTPVAVPAMLKYYLTNAPYPGVKAAMEAMYADDEKLTEERLSEYRALMAGQGDAFVARAAQFTLPDPGDDLAALPVPTTLIWGEDDAVLPVAHAETFSAHLSNVEVLILPNVGHLPQAEAPDTVIAAIEMAAQTESSRP